MAREQRRLAAIVAADVVGYSRLMGRDEAGTLARLRAHRKERFEPALVRHGGRLVKLTGDGALAEFGSAVDALSAAIAFQQALADANRGLSEDSAILFRIGVHLGDLIVDGDDLYGDAVNVAARLETAAPPGGILVSGDVRNAVAGRLKATFADLGELALKNIEQKVRAFRIEWDAADWPVAQALESLTTPNDAPLTLLDRPSIAVLPFQNMSGDPEQEYFADGIVEDIITALSRDRGLLVIARNSSFIYKGRAVDMRQVGRELGIRYALEGSVRKAANRVRITAQLIEANTGSHLWADRFDGGLEDIFELQDRIANKVASVVSPAVEWVEIERATPKTLNLRAYDFFLKAKAAYYRSTSADLDQALDLAQRSLALDQNFARSHALIAAIYALRVVSSFSIDSIADVAAAERSAQRALALDSNDATIVIQYAHVLLQLLGRHDEGLAMVDKAIELDPNLAIAWVFRGMLKGRQGNTAEAILDLEHALRLSPRDPRGWLAKHALAWAHLMAGRCDEAVSWAMRVLQVQPNLGFTLRVVIAAHALAGRLDKAHEALKTHLTVEPHATLSALRESYLRRVTPQAFEVLADGLRKAGFPE